MRGFSCPEESGVSVVDNVSRVAVSPVPFNAALNVAFTSQSAFDGRIILYDIFGIQALAYPVQIIAGNQSLAIPTGHLPNGYYTMMLEAAGGSRILLKKLIRQE